MSNFLEYHKSIVAEIQATQNRVRYLIDDTHWQTDGEHKETILRHILRTHLPETHRIGRGFICYREGNSTQLDVLITSKDKPTLYKDGDLVFVTPDAVDAMFEVKTKLGSPRGLDKALSNLVNHAEKVRQDSPNCLVGLFVFNNNRLHDDQVLQVVRELSEGNQKRAVNFIALGRNLFLRYWDNDERKANRRSDGPVWHTYELEDLAHAYFVSNVALSLNLPGSVGAQYAWFPIEGGKRTRRTAFIALNREEGVQYFNDEDGLSGF